MMDDVLISKMLEETLAITTIVFSYDVDRQCYCYTHNFQVLEIPSNWLQIQTTDSNSIHLDQQTDKFMLLSVLSQFLGSPLSQVILTCRHQEVQLQIAA